MPVRVESYGPSDHRIVESSGRVVARSRSRRKAYAAAAIRNRESGTGMPREAFDEAKHLRDRRGRWRLESLNPTGGVFVHYDPASRATAPLGGTLTTLDKTMGVSPDRTVTIYRGAPTAQKEIAPGDFVTTSRQLAADYGGDGHVIAKQVPASHVLDDASEPLGEEYIYRPPVSKAKGEIREAFGARAAFDTLKHPRGRGGKWIDTARIEKAGATVERDVRIERPDIVRKQRPLAQTEAFRRGKRRPAYLSEFGRHGDEFMYDLAIDQGFAGRPHVVSEAEFAAHVAQGDIEMWRGVTDKSYAELFTSGPAFYGQGFRGNGIYAASGEKAKAKAVAYAQTPPTRGTIVQKVDEPVVIHMALRKDARIVSYEEAELRARQEQAGAGSEPLKLALSSPTRWALAHGYDAVVIDKEGGDREVAVLNRTALVVSDAFESAGQNVTARLRQARHGSRRVLSLREGREAL